MPVRSGCVARRSTATLKARLCVVQFLGIWIVSSAKPLVGILVRSRSIRLATCTVGLRRSEIDGDFVHGASRSRVSPNRFVRYNRTDIIGHRNNLNNSEASQPISQETGAGFKTVSFLHETWMRFAAVHLESTPPMNPPEEYSLLSQESRAWWHGFMSGFMGLDLDYFKLDEYPVATQERLPVSPLPQSTQNFENTPTVEIETAETFPWHDPELPIVTRIGMANGQPLERKLMAAMGQLDCGACGYLCKTYGEAIAHGEEPDLGLCVPGGSETQRTLTQMVQSHGPIQMATPSPNAVTQNWSRRNPFIARIVNTRQLNHPESAKQTTHVEIDLAGSNLTYQVGDALGIRPSNCPALVNATLRLIGADPQQQVSFGEFTGSLRTAVMDWICLKTPSDELLEFVRQRSSSPAVQKIVAKMFADGIPDGIDVYDIIKVANLPSIPVSDFLRLVRPIQPRLYSIASSMRAVGDHVHLTVGKVSFQRNGRQRKGVASTMFADRLQPGDDVAVFVVKNQQGFTIPENPDAPMIMVGPGTGVAPFLAFLQEREARGARGKNWLFFGNPHQATDFLYEKQLREYVDGGLLAKLTTAFSRDEEQKVYVQDRMKENASQLYNWLQQGAYFYVCGDAKRMAKDVDRTLKEIVIEQGKMSIEAASNYVSNLTKQKRYVRDIY